MKNNEFLQSKEWLNFQEAFGRKTHFIKNEHFLAGIIEHVLPIVGKYFYIPRGPISESNSGMLALVALAKKEKAGWIRIEPRTEKLLEEIRKSTVYKITKAPYDVQPKEVLVLDIAKKAEELLVQMKSKTRYNIGVAKKRGVEIKSYEAQSANEKDRNAFLKLTSEMAKRQGIMTHPENYYRKMLEIFPAKMLKLYVAEYASQIIAANLVLFYDEKATYLHGASGDEHRNVMAPYLLQWQAILDAKEQGCIKYDFGGVATQNTWHKKHSDLSGVTNFKLGFAPDTKAIVFPGTFDIIINPRQYALYKGLQKAKMMIKKFSK